MKLEEIIKKETVIVESEDLVILEEARGRSTRIKVIPKGKSKEGPVKKSLQGVTKMISDHPVISAGLALYAYKKYKKHRFKQQRKIITFFSTDPIEKKMHKDIVKTLMGTGKYLKKKAEYVDGGYMWVLKKVD
jgi:hypothetical protein